MDILQDGDTLNSALEETSQLLSDWYFAFSESGLVYVRPTLKELTPDRLAHFVDRLRLACDHQFPEVIALDFATTAIVDWSGIQTIIAEFAKSLDARSRTIPVPCRPKAMTVIYRGHRPLKEWFGRAHAIVAEERRPNG